MHFRKNLSINCLARKKSWTKIASCFGGFPIEQTGNSGAGDYRSSSK
jgi:hypothetical protein